MFHRAVMGTNPHDAFVSLLVCFLIIAASLRVYIQQERDYIAIHGKLVVFRSLYCNVWKLSGSLASVQGFLTRQAAGTITQLLLAHVIAWQIVSTRW